MLLSSILTISLAPLAVLAGTPGALRSLSGKDYSHHLRRTDEPFPVRLSYTKRGPVAVPRTLMQPAAPIRRSGVLVASRQLGCDPGSSICPDGNGCCITGAECCTQVAMCCSGGPCCGASCCENNGICCGTAGCCDQGNTCATINGVTGCCKAGQTCEAFSGCANPSLVECGGDLPFCCPRGETCGRDSAGNATCNGQSATNAAISSGAASPTPGNSVISVPGSTLTTFTTSGTHGSTTATVTSPSGTSTSTGSATQTSSPNIAYMNSPAHGIAGLVAAIFVWLI